MCSAPLTDMYRSQVRTCTTTKILLPDTASVGGQSLRVEFPEHFRIYFAGFENPHIVMRSGYKSCCMTLTREHDLLLEVACLPSTPQFFFKGTQDLDRWDPVKG